MKNFGGPLALGGIVAIALGSGLHQRMLPQRPPPAMEDYDNRYPGGEGASGGGAPSSQAEKVWGNGTNQPPTGVPQGNATQTWRGNTDRDVEALRAQLPPQAKHLADDFVAAGKAHNIDPAFLMAISAHETGQWTSNAFLNRNNAMGVSNAAGVVNQTSHADSIHRMAGSLAGAPGFAGYYNNAQTIGDVGRIYAPVGAGNDPNNQNQYWASGVSGYYNRYTQ